MANNELLCAYLDLLAAKAKQLALDVKGNRVWPGDVAKGLVEVRDALSKAESAARNDR